MQIIAILVASLAAFVSAQDAEVSSSITFSTTTTAAIDDVATIDIPATLPVASSTVLASTMTTTTTAAAGAYTPPAEYGAEYGCADAANPQSCGDYCVPAGQVCCGTGAAFGATFCPAGAKCVGVDQCEVDGVTTSLPLTYKAVGKKTTTQLIYSGASTNAKCVGAAAFAVVAAAALF